MFVNRGSVRRAAATSATPKNSWNQRGKNSFNATAMSGGGARNIQP
jgi:hypothetical protein